MKWNFVVKKRPAEMKAWQDCQWKRIPCDGDDCPICGSIKKDRQAAIERGDDPDDPEVKIEDLSRNFLEIIELLRQGAEKHGVDLDEFRDEDLDEEERFNPTDYPIYNKIMEWRQGIYDIHEECDVTSQAWKYTEAGEDLVWYMSTLLVKVARQLNNFEELKKGREESIDLEYNYTGYVLGEVLGILDNALITLSTEEHTLNKQFNLARLSFDSIKDEILNIN